MLVLYFLLTELILARSAFNIYVNASNISSKTIWNPWNTINSADYTNKWLNEQSINNTNPTIHDQYPFLTRQKFAYSTGGCYKGYTDPYNNTCKTTFDLLSDPSDPNSSYNFTQIHTAIDNVIKMGLKPYIVTGLIPIAYSINATLSAAKNLNELPPSYSYEKYGEYIYEFGKYLVNNYGKNEINDWIFGVITEYNNYHHFDDIYNSNNTENEYFKVYDYTECNLKKAFGSNNFKIGAHSCRNCPAKLKWNADDLLNHIANGINYCTGIKGETQIDFYSSSFYEHAPGDPGDLSNFDEYICSMNDIVKKYNLTDKIKEIAIDEGRIIADQYNVQMGSRATGHTYQASWDSLLFINMIRCNITRFVRWGINSNGIGLYTQTNIDYITSLDPVSANVIKLTYKMVNDNILDMLISTTNIDIDNNNTQIVNGLSSISKQNDGLIHIFLFNHNSNLFSNKTANINLYVCNITQNNDNNICNITEWLIDDNNSQYWNIYWNDIIQHNITQFCPIGWSNQSEHICISNKKDHDYIQSRVPIYQNASKLASNKYQINYDNGCLNLTQEMPSHSVRLFELSC